MHSMSTSKPRITITLKPFTALQLKKISDLTGSSQSSMVSDVLEQAEPMFDRLIKVLEAAELAKQSAVAARQSVRIKSLEDLDEAQRRIEAQMGLVLEEFDGATAPLLEELEKVSRRGRRQVGEMRSRTPASALSTPMSNRGVRLTQKQEKSIAQNDQPATTRTSKVGRKTRGGS